MKRVILAVLLMGSFGAILSIVGVGGRSGALSSQASGTATSLTYAWGSDSFGQLGTGATPPTTDFNPNLANVQMPSDVTFTSIAGGGLHALALGSTGKLYSWGADDWGQLGNGTSTDTPTLVPTVVPLSSFPSGATSITAVAAGSSFSLALDSAGSIYSWGSNFSGQLGNATMTGSVAPVLVATPEGMTFTSIAAGSDFALALASNGGIYAWGANPFGQLGNGTTTGSDVPVPVTFTPALPTGTSVTAVAAGNGFSMALTNTGAVYAWGDNDDGELGLGGTNYTDQSNPTVAVSPAVSGATFTAISAGDDFAVALTETGGVESWGDNDLGQLGNGNNAIFDMCNVEGTGIPTADCSNVPVGVDVAADGTFVAVSAGNTQGYALSSHGNLYAWGDDQYGQLGNGGTVPTNEATPGQVVIPNGGLAGQVFSGSQSSFGFMTTPQDQTITFPSNLTMQYGKPPFPFGATASSGLPVTLSSSTPTVCTASASGILTVLAAGICTVTGVQNGSDQFSPAPPVTMSYTVNKAPLTLTADNLQIPQGSVPKFTYTLSPFVNHDTEATAGLTGSASCTSTGTSASPVGKYPITCTAGSLAAPNYVVANIVNATLTIFHSADQEGYQLVATDGGIFSFGNAKYYGSTGNIHLNKPIVGMAEVPKGGGYWLVASDGGIFSFGDAVFHGSTGNLVLNQPIVGMAVDPATGGYWLVAADGGIFSFGATYYGSTGNIHLNKPIVGMAATADGGGYWLVASDGGIFSFGDAKFYGSTGNIVLNRPIVGMAVAPAGTGYWMVAADGGIFTFGSAVYSGTTAGTGLSSPVIGMLPDPAGGYWLTTAVGGVYPFGGAPDYGSLLNIHLNAPITGIG